MRFFPFKKFLWLIGMIAWVALIVQTSFGPMTTMTTTISTVTQTGDDTISVGQTGSTSTTTPRSSPALTDTSVSVQSLQQLSREQVQSIVSGHQQDTIDANKLQQLYTMTQDPSLLPALISQSISEFDFDSAAQYLMLARSGAVAIDVYTQAYVLFNSRFLSRPSAQNSRELLTQRTQIQQQGGLTSDDSSFYQGLIFFTQGDMTGYIASIRALTSSGYDSIRTAVMQSIDRYQSFRDSPPEYLEALLALDLLNHGYFRIAQQRSVSVLARDEDYLLPYQILAYSHFVMNNRQIAQDYCNELIRKDPSRADQYKFFIAVSLYRQGKYTEALIYLSQLQNSPFQDDVYRYSILSYQALNDYSRIAAPLWGLLGQSSLQPEDMRLVFDIAFYQPFVQQKPSQLMRKQGTLLTQYVQSCTQKISADQYDVCEYGNIGLLLSQGLLSQAGQRLETLVKTMPKSYLYQALGDYYVAVNQFDDAKTAYITALALTADPTLQSITKSKLLGVMPLVGR